MPTRSEPSEIVVGHLITFTQKQLTRQARALLARDTVSFLVFLGAGTGIITVVVATASATRHLWSLGAIMAFTLSLSVAWLAQLGANPAMGPDVATFYEETRTMSASKASVRLLRALQAEARSNAARLGRQHIYIITSLVLMVLGMAVLLVGLG